jgi:hypothetical protein
LCGHERSGTERAYAYESLRASWNVAGAVIDGGTSAERDDSAPVALRAIRQGIRRGEAAPEEAASSSHVGDRNLLRRRFASGLRRASVERLHPRFVHVACALAVVTDALLALASLALLASELRDRRGAVSVR